MPPTSFSKLFDQYLSEHNLLIDPVTKKRRVLYSLRHTYATLALTYDRINPLTLAKQMGTSIAMIEQHYSHLDAVSAVLGRKVRIQCVVKNEGLARKLTL